MHAKQHYNKGIIYAKIRVPIPPITQTVGL